MKTFSFKTIYSFLCLFSLVSTTALADDIEEETIDYLEIDGINYHVTSFTDLTVSVNSCSNVSGNVILPGVVTLNDEDYHVTSIADDAFRDCVDLSSIIISNSVTSIGESAFWGCSGLTSITLSDNITAISDYTFSGCSGLTTLTIPNKVTSIGNYAFSACSSLTSVSIPNSVITIGNYAFAGCSSLSSPIYNTSFFFFPTNYQGDYVIPDGIKTIQPSAFYQCKGLTSVTIPNSVISIGSAAFSGCDNLKSVTIPGNVTEIGSRAFEDCPLREIYIKCIVPPNQDSKNNTTRAFSTAAFYHAVLYVPMETWNAYAYDDGWCYFINIREVTNTVQEISERKTYTLMNTDDFNYTIYDPINNSIRSNMASHSVDESNPNHCWQMAEANGKTYLYNIGAKKFVVQSTDGEGFALSDTPDAITMENGDDGIVLSGQQKTQWAFVVNESQNTDQDLNNLITGIQSTVEQSQENTVDWYTLDGRNMEKEPIEKGVYIVNGKKVYVN